MQERDQWHGIEIRHVAALAAISRERSFSRAGEALGYSQSAISQQIARLESIVGTPLVERPGGPQPVRLTQAGALLVVHADAIVARLAAARADVAALGEVDEAMLKVGCYQSAGARILAPMLEHLRADHLSSIGLVLREAADDGVLLDAVENGDLDLTFAVLPLQDGPFEAVELVSDPYVLVVRSDSELADAQRPISVSQVRRLPLISYRDLRRVHMPETRLGQRLETANIVFRSDDDETIHALVGAGVGSAVIPALAYNPRYEQLTAVPVAIPERVVALVRHAERSLTPPVEAFIRAARLVAANVQRELDTMLAAWRPPLGTAARDT